MRELAAITFAFLCSTALAGPMEISTDKGESFTDCISHGKLPNQDLTFCFDENTGERAVFSTLPEPLNSCYLQLLPSDLHDALKPDWQPSTLSKIGMGRCIARVGAKKTNDPEISALANYADDLYAGVKSGRYDGATSEAALDAAMLKAAESFNARQMAAACPASGVTFVMPYVRSNGTLVRGHLRSNPDGLQCNNLKN